MANAGDALMSYSFTIFASSREQAKAMVAAKLDELTTLQPVHRFDRDQALHATSAYVDICDEPTDKQELAIDMQGSVSWSGSDTGQQVIGANVSIAVWTVAKRAAAA